MNVYSSLLSALRKKSPVIINNYFDCQSSDEIENDEPHYHCSPRRPLTGINNHPFWNRGFFDFIQKEDPRDGLLS